jgi:hypothetical protein
LHRRTTVGARAWRCDLRDQPERAKRLEIDGRDADQAVWQHVVGSLAVDEQQQIALRALLDQRARLHLHSPRLGLDPGH